MSKTDNPRVEVQQMGDYELGWKAASMGLVQPFRITGDGKLCECANCRVQRMGWQDYHDQEKQP